MCGIVGYIGNHKGYGTLLKSLQRLEYRGYDSAGIAGLKDGEFIVHRTVDQIASLMDMHKPEDVSLGISHTRWATHGKPSIQNAHPHTDTTGDIILVHNGIVENFQILGRELQEKGHVFKSETDTEILSHLIEREIIESGITGTPDRDTFLGIIHKAFSHVVGTYACAILHKGIDGLFGVRNQSPMVVGLGNGENIIASDVTAVLEYTNRVVYLEDDQYVHLDREKVSIWNGSEIAEDGTLGDPVQQRPTDIQWSLEEAEKGGFDHYMQKEIFEQPRSLHQVLIGKQQAQVLLDFSKLPPPTAVKIIACGTSYHAGMMGKYMFEELAGIPVSMEYASEYRYAPPVDETPLILGISQSGETADTLAALREAKKRGCTVQAITNVVGSTICREVDEVLYMKAGPEIGVAATKSFLNTTMVLFFLAVRNAVLRERISPRLADQLIREAQDIPQKVNAVLDSHEDIRRLAKRYSSFPNSFFIGRHIHFPSALEAALKLKEISYIHAEAFAAGEIKHGPLALLEENTPVIAILTESHVFEKTLSNVKEISARMAPVIAVIDDPDRVEKGVADHFIRVPKTHPLLSPFVVAVALQLYSYYAADARGCAIDKPRNLAKSVTVE